MIRGNVSSAAQDQVTIVSGSVMGGININHGDTQDNTDIQINNSKAGRGININKPK